MDEWPDDWDEIDIAVYQMIIDLRGKKIPRDEILRRVKEMRAKMESEKGLQ